MRYLISISFKMAVMASRVTLLWIMVFLIINSANFASCSPTVYSTSNPVPPSTTRQTLEILQILGTTPPPGTPYIAIDAPMNNETVIPGDSVTLNCRIRGYPKPTYWWYRNDAIIRDDIGRNVVREFKGGSTLTINNVGTLDTGSYKCIAANDNGTKSVQGSITLNANSPTYSESSVSDYLDEMSVDEPQCEPYRGSVCSPHIANSQVYIPAGQTQADIEAALGAAIQQINNDLPITLNQRCTKYLKPSMCLTAFPLCRERPRLAVHRMCYDECRLLTTEICSSLVDYVDAQPELGLVDMLPICTDLPLPGAVAGANSENSCLRMGMSESGVATITPFGVPTARYFIIMERPMNNETELHTGDKATLRCRIIGDPTPHYKWYKNDALLTEERRDRRITTKEYEWGSKLSIRNVDTTDTGYYKCVAENRAGVRSTMGILFARIASETTRPVAAIPSQGYCQPYRGMTCSNFISNHSIYVTDFQAQKLIDERLTQAFLLMARDLSPQCQQYAIPSLCFFAFPFCDETRQEPRGRELCRDECEILEQDICKTEYQIAKEMPNVILPDCSRLPAIGTNANANCIRVGLPDVAAVTDHKCYNDTGEDYRGRINTTKSGFACQSWDKQEPHEHALWPSHYRELAGGHNFCRNPGNGLDKPWCFTTNPDVRAEKCDIPRCEFHHGSTMVPFSLGLLSVVQATLSAWSMYLGLY